MEEIWEGDSYQLENLRLQLQFGSGTGRDEALRGVRGEGAKKRGEGCGKKDRRKEKGGGGF